MVHGEAIHTRGNKMAYHDLMNADRLEMLKWVSERNVHVPLSDLAFMLDVGGDDLPDGFNEPDNRIYNLQAD